MAKDVSPLDDAGHAMVVPGFAGKLRRGKTGAFRLDPWPSHGSTPLFAGAHCPSIYKKV
jgi:hypothetical protein